MSAFTVGSQTTTTDATKAKLSNKPNDEGPGQAFVKWIPGDAIVFYTALLTLGAGQAALTGKETPEQLLQRINASSPGWFLFALAASAALVVAGALKPSVPGSIALPALLARVALTVVAFVIWSSLLPGSWSSGWHLVRDLGPAYVLVIAVVAVLFTAIAQWLTTKFKI